VIGAIILAVTLLAAGIDDLWVTWEGGDSVTRRLVDHLTHVGATAEAVAALKQRFAEMFPVLSKLALVAGVPFEGINKVLWAVMPALQAWRFVLGSIGAAMLQIQTTATNWPTP
jgi:hypothetical protein